MFESRKFQNHRAVRLLAAALGAALLGSGAEAPYDYKILGTSRTSTMQREIDEAAAAGYRFSRIVGGKVLNGGQILVLMVKGPGAAPVQEPRKYKLVATTRTSTMQVELQQWADQGYVYRDHAVLQTAKTREMVVMMELDSKRQSRPRYLLLAAIKASTLERELLQAGSQGYELLGFTSGGTPGGGDEIVAILQK